MITVISATQRAKSLTSKVALSYSKLLYNKDIDHKVLYLNDLAPTDLYENFNGDFTPSFSSLVDKYLLNSNKFVVVSPEYHGSYPGAFKSFIDCVGPTYFKTKKVAFVGVSSGRAGNIRGMDHLTTLFHHIRAEVYSDQIKLSGIHNLMDDSGQINDLDSLKVLNAQIEGFVSF